MNLKDQVCSLEPSKKLKELRVKQESLWGWADYIPDNGSSIGIPKRRIGIVDEYDLLHCIKLYDKYSAFTVAELGEMLPKNLAYSQQAGVGILKWECNYVFNKDTYYGDEVHTEYANTEANARAKMLVYLLENKLMEEVS